MTCIPFIATLNLFHARTYSTKATRRQIHLLIPFRTNKKKQFAQLREKANEQHKLQFR